MAEKGRANRRLLVTTTTASPISASAEPKTSRRRSPIPLNNQITDRRRRIPRLRSRNCLTVMLVGVTGVGLFALDRFFGAVLMNNLGLASLYESTYTRNNLSSLDEEGRLPSSYPILVTSSPQQQQQKRQKQTLSEPIPIFQPPDLPEKCAICFWGLPRAFSAVVLPTLIQNILIPNAKYHCDFFVHYHHLEHEVPSRSGRGGVLNPEEIFELAEAVKLVASNSSLSSSGDKNNTSYKPIVRFAKSTDSDFYRRRGAFLNRTHTAKDSKGRYKYFPWKERSFHFPTTTDNVSRMNGLTTATAVGCLERHYLTVAHSFYLHQIVRMWDGLSAAWNLLTETETKLNVNYTRVAMLRSDVAFITPIDIYSIQGNKDINNVQRTAVVPGFAKWPVNDRMIYGPAPAVAIWASERFKWIERHVAKVARSLPGRGMQDEYYLDLTIFPAIRKLGITIVEDETLCFLRARADESVWVNDCGNVKENKRIIEHLIHRTCRIGALEDNLKKGVTQLECRDDIQIDSK